jgi:hypothetical protein
MSCVTVSGVSDYSRGIATYERPSVGIKALARDAEGFVVAEQTPVV